MVEYGPSFVKVKRSQGDSYNEKKIKKQTRRKATGDLITNQCASQAMSRWT